MVAPVSLRLLAGELRGRRIEVPAGVRPTESRVREALFSIWRDQVPGCHFLDLFAGSGAVGLEAWSLGAARVCFVEQAPRVLAALRKNLGTVTQMAAPLMAAPQAEVVRGRLPEVLSRRLKGCFDLLFADPPYAYERYADLIEAAGHRAGPRAELAVEHSVRLDMADEVAGWCRSDQRRYGESCISFYRSADRS